jgi:hypothetical protein
VGPLGVEFLGEGIEAGLLLQGIEGWRAGGFLLEGEVHALMPAVLLGMAWLDALDGDAQAQPPDGELGEVEQGVGGGEGDAVVGAYGGGQAALGEEVIEGGDGGVLADRGESLAEEEEAGGVVGDGERVAILAVAEAELALDVDAPEVVGVGAGGERCALGAAARVAVVADQAVAIADGVDGAGGGRLDVVGQTAEEEFAQLSVRPNAACSS